MDNFVQILTSIQSPDNNVRQAAEQQYESLNVSDKTQALLQVLASPANPESQSSRVLSAVLLRKLLTAVNPDVDMNMSPLMVELKKSNNVAGFKNQILQVCQNNFNDGLMTSKLANLLADTYLMDASNDWAESLELVLTASKENSLGMNFALNVILCYAAMVEKMGNGKVVNLIARAFDSENAETTYLAARASCAYLISLEDECNVEAIIGFGTMLGKVIKIIELSVLDDNDTVIKQFIDVVCAEHLQPLLKQGFNDIICFALGLIGNEEVNDENKQLALECIITLVETFPGLIRKLATTVQKTGGNDPITGTIQACIHFIEQVEDDDDWLTADQEDDTEYTSNTLTGEANIDRLACALRGSCILPRLTEILPSKLGSANWQERYAGLSAISAVAEGCSQHMSKILPDVLRQVVQFTADSHGRVRYAAANCLGQLAIDFQEKFCKMSHEQVVPALCILLNDQTMPKVIGQAAAALVNFVESLPKSIMKKYTDSIVNLIEENMQREFQLGRKFTLQQLITLLAALAGQLDDDFLPYYDRFMPGLTDMIRSTVDKEEYSKLRGKAVECFSIIGLAVGKEKFAPAAKETIEVMLKLQITPEMWLEDDDTIQYMISAWTRIAKVLGEDFSPYLPHVMPPLLQACKIKPEVSILEEDEANNLDVEQWQVVRMPGDTSQIGIKTSGIELKTTAFSMLVCYVKEVGKCPDFQQYLKDVIELAVSELKFYFDGDVRVYAAQIIESIVDHYKIDPWHQYNLCHELTNSIREDPDLEVKPEIMDVLAKCIEDLMDTPDQIFRNDQEIGEIFELLGEYLSEHLDNSYARTTQRAGEEHDDGDEEELAEGAETDEYILQKIVDILHSIFGTQKEKALPFYEKLHESFKRLIDPSSVFSDRQWALCVFDDIIERCGQHALKYADFFLPHLVNGLTDDAGEIRQACAYGIGILAKSCDTHSLQGSIYDQALMKGYEILTNVVSTGLAQQKNEANLSPDECEFEVEPWENAVSSMGKVIRYASYIKPMEGNFKQWMQFLDQAGGITSDQEEAEATYEWLNLLVTENNPHLIGDSECLVIYVSLIGDLLVSGVLDDDGVEVKNKAVGILKSMAGQDAAAFGQMVASWDDNKKFLLEDAMKS